MQMLQEMIIAKSSAQIIPPNQIQNGMIILVEGTEKEVYNINQYGNTFEVEFLDIASARFNNILIHKMDTVRVLRKHKTQFQPIHIQDLKSGMKVYGLEQEEVIITNIEKNKNYYSITYRHHLLFHEETLNLETQGYLFVSSISDDNTIEHSNFPIVKRYISNKKPRESENTKLSKLQANIHRPAFLGMGLGLVYITFILLMGVFIAFGSLLNYLFSWSLNSNDQNLWWGLELLLQIPIILTKLGIGLFDFGLHVVSDQVIRSSASGIAIGGLTIIIGFTIFLFLCVDFLQYIRKMYFKIEY